MAATIISQPHSTLSKTESYVGNKRKEYIRQANIVAARAVDASNRYFGLFPQGYIQGHRCVNGFGCSGRIN